MGFPFAIDGRGRVSTLAGDDNIHAKIIQVLLTSPGERVQSPEFGCGLRDLLFDPNNELLAAATEFEVNKSLQRWLGDEVIVEGVNIEAEGESLHVEVVYVRRDRLEPGRIKITV